MRRRHHRRRTHSTHRRKSTHKRHKSTKKHNSRKAKLAKDFHVRGKHAKVHFVNRPRGW